MLSSSRHWWPFRCSQILCSLKFWKEGTKSHSYHIHFSFQADFFQKRQMTNIVHSNIWRLTWSRNLITRKLKTVIKANYCNYHCLTYPTRCSHKKQIMRQRTYSRNTQTDFTQTQQKLCCNFETVIIAHYFNISRPSSVSYNIMKICAKMYSTTIFSSLPRTIDHREGGTGNIIIFNKTSSSIYRKGGKIR